MALKWPDALEPTPSSQHPERTTMSHEPKPRPAIIAALANVYPELFRESKTFVPMTPEEVLVGLGDLYCIAIHKADPVEIAQAEARLSDHLRTHFPGVTVALTDEIAVVFLDSTPAGKVHRVQFRSAI